MRVAKRWVYTESIATVLFVNPCMIQSASPLYSTPFRLQSEYGRANVESIGQTGVLNGTPKIDPRWIRAFVLYLFSFVFCVRHQFQDIEFWVNVVEWHNPDIVVHDFGANNYVKTTCY